MADVEMSGKEIKDMVERTADVLNIVYWHMVETERDAILAASMLEGAKRALLIESGCCTCDNCMDAHNRLAEIIADQLEMVSEH